MTSWWPSVLRRLRDVRDRFSTSYKRRVSPPRQRSSEARLPLVEEVAAVSPVLRIMADQLRDVSQQIESGIVETSMAFQGIAQQARQAVSVLNNAQHDDSNDAEQLTADELIQQTRESMLTLLERLQTAAHFSTDVASRTGSMLSHLDRVEECLGNVNVLARQAKLVALNGRIEASRAGEQGKAFAVVAQETNEFAVHAVATSGTIHSVVEDLSQSLSTTAQELQQHAHDESSRMNESESNVTKTLNLLASTQERMSRQLCQVTQINQCLSHDISRAVMSLQFQDAVCQRLEHIMNTLETFSSLMEAETQDVAHHTRVQQRTKEWVVSMSQAFTMDSERRIAGIEGSQEQVAIAEPGGCSVELF